MQCPFIFSRIFVSFSYVMKMSDNFADPPFLLTNFYCTYIYQKTIIVRHQSDSLETARTLIFKVIP